MRGRVFDHPYGCSSQTDDRESSLMENTGQNAKSVAIHQRRTHRHMHARTHAHTQTHTRGHTLSLIHRKDRQFTHFSHSTSPIHTSQLSHFHTHICQHQMAYTSLLKTCILAPGKFNAFPPVSPSPSLSLSLAPWFDRPSGGCPWWPSEAPCTAES